MPFNLNLYLYIMKKNKKTRIIKKDGLYIPQKLFHIPILGIKRWKSFYENCYYVVVGHYSETVKELITFVSKQQAKDFLREKGYKL